MRALIFGATGAIGSAVARRASQRDWDVQAAGRAGSDWHRLSESGGALVRHAVEISDPAAIADLVSAASPDWILMSAFPSHASTNDRASLRKSMHANVGGVLDGLALSGFDGGVTWIGSSLAYRDPRTSASLPREGRIYLERGEVKAEESRLVASLATERSLSLTELRVFTGFGPWEQPSRLVPALLRSALGGDKPRLAATGTRRDWIHYEDIADACLASALWRGRGPRLLDACSGAVHDAGEVASLLGEIVGKSLVAAGELDRHVGYGDSIPGRVPGPDELDWRPRLSLAQGLEQCWGWARSPAGRCWLLEPVAACA